MSFFLEHTKLPNMYQVYNVVYVCGNVNRRYHYVEALRSHTQFEKYILLHIDVSRNSRTRILVTVVNLCALVVSEIDST